MFIAFGEVTDCSVFGEGILAAEWAWEWVSKPRGSFCTDDNDVDDGTPGGFCMLLDVATYIENTHIMQQTTEYI